MTFPAYYLLIPYLLFTALAGLVFFFNVYHIAKFGLQSTKTAFVLGLYTLGFFGVAIISAVLLSQYDWVMLINPADALQLDFSSTPSL